MAKFTLNEYRILGRLAMGGREKLYVNHNFLYLFAITIS